MNNDRFYLEKTLTIAEETLRSGSHPIGCVITDDSGEIVMTAKNEFAKNGDVTAHAEIVAFRALGKIIDKHAPGNFILYSSLEPCFGCSFFIARTNINKVVSTLADPHKGGISKLSKQEQFLDFFKKIEIINEPYPDLRNRSLKLMHDYFVSVGNHKAAEIYGDKGGDI